MNAAAGSSARRRRVLAELGLVRYRLRDAPATPAIAVAPVVDPTVADRGDGMFCVFAADSPSAPANGIAATIWLQVLAWLGYAADDIRWQPGNGAIELPAPATWATPQGKRALWRALKGSVRKVH